MGKSEESGCLKNVENELIEKETYCLFCRCFILVCSFWNIDIEIHDVLGICIFRFFNVIKNLLFFFICFPLF